MTNFLLNFHKMCIILYFIRNSIIIFILFKDILSMLSMLITKKNNTLIY